MIEGILNEGFAIGNTAIAQQVSQTNIHRGKPPKCLAEDMARKYPFACPYKDSNDKQVKYVPGDIIVRSQEGTPTVVNVVAQIYPGGPSGFYAAGPNDSAENRDVVWRSIP